MGKPGSDASSPVEVINSDGEAMPSDDSPPAASVQSNCITSANAYLLIYRRRSWQPGPTPAVPDRSVLHSCSDALMQRTARFLDIRGWDQSQALEDGTVKCTVLALPSYGRLQTLNHPQMQLQSMSQYRNARALILLSRLPDCSEGNLENCCILCGPSEVHGSAGLSCRACCQACLELVMEWSIWF